MNCPAALSHGKFPENAVNPRELTNFPSLGLWDTSGIKGRCAQEKPSKSYIMIIQFGKYKGQDINDVPLSYITWLLVEGEHLDSGLEYELKQSMIKRLDLIPHNEKTDVSQYIDSVHRQMTTKYKKNGTPREVSVINEYHSLLKEKIK